MGRSSTGAIHHFTALKLSMTYILNCTSKNSEVLNRVVSWNVNGEPSGKISYDVSLKEENRYLRLKYIHTDWHGEKHNIDYIIRIIGVPSNLGKGENLYFVCPISHKLCKILYSCYWSKYFMSRGAYNHRIYYTSQIFSKKDRVNNRYFELDKTLEGLNEKQIKSHYKGEETKLQKRINRLEVLKENFDNRRYENFIRSTDAILSKCYRKK